MSALGQTTKADASIGQGRRPVPLWRFTPSRDRTRCVLTQTASDPQIFEIGPWSNLDKTD